MFPRLRYGSIACASFLSAAMLFMDATPLAADLVYFRNSKYSKGKVLGRGPGHVYFRTEDGLRIEIPLEMIRKIIILDEKEEQRLAAAAREDAKRRAHEAERVKAMRETEARIRRANREAEKRIARERERAEMAELRRKVDKLVAEQLDDAWRLRAGAARRSAVLPGWGQHHMNRPRAGWAFNVAIALAALYTFGAYRDLRAAERDFAQVGPPLAIASIPGPDGFTPAPEGSLLSSLYLDDKEAAADGALRKVNLGLLLMLVTWGWNIFDVLNAEAPARIRGAAAAADWKFSLDLSGAGREGRFSVRTGIRF